MNISIFNNSKHCLPLCFTEASEGIDIRDSINSEVIQNSVERTVVYKGLTSEIPLGYGDQIQPRRGLEISNAIIVFNLTGKIDSYYRVEVCIILGNLFKEIYVSKDEERIRQKIFFKHVIDECKAVDDLCETKKGSCGFGYTERLKL